MLHKGASSMSQGFGEEWVTIRGNWARHVSVERRDQGRGPTHTYLEASCNEICVTWKLSQWTFRMKAPARIQWSQIMDLEGVDGRLKRTACFKQGSRKSSKQLTQNFSSEWRAFCQSQQQRGQNSINHFTREPWVHFWQMRGNHWSVAISETNGMSAIKCKLICTVQKQRGGRRVASPSKSSHIMLALSHNHQRIARQIEGHFFSQDFIMRNVCCVFQVFRFNSKPI